ncbi:unnamed protein product [Ectocarpus sp. 12 AP-2014]
MGWATPLQPSVLTSFGAEVSSRSLSCRVETVRQALQDLVWSLLRVPNVLNHDAWEPPSVFLVSEDEGSDLAYKLERCISSCHNSADVPASLEVLRHMLERKVDLKYVHRLLRLEDESGSAADDEKQDKVTRFVEKLRETVCGICHEPLLDSLLESIYTDMFGVVSWRCRCKTPMAHTACLFSLMTNMDHPPRCGGCRSPMTFGKSRSSGRGYERLNFHHADGAADVDSSGGSW